MFRSGDRVVHTGRPEWGAGIVLSSQRTPDDQGQTLKVRFERAGLKTVSAPPAAIERSGVAGVSEPGGGEADPETLAARLTTLPEATRDPFDSLAARLRATVALYRFDATGGSLIDWAASQSGLADPLSRFTRQELEQLFSRFVTERDAHLKKLSEEARRSSPETLEVVVREAPASARAALSRLIRR